MDCLLAGHIHARLSTVPQLPPLGHGHSNDGLQQMQDCTLLQRCVPEGALENWPQALLQEGVKRACDF